MEKKKKILLIIGIVLLILILGIGSYFIFFNNDSKKDNSIKNEKTEDKIVAPASNTEELIKEMSIVEIQNVSDDEIVFAENVELKENETVAIWIYSEPKFLGYFEILIENGTKKIVGLKKALENISIEIGKHNIAITAEDGEPIGYIDVYIEESGIILLILL